MITATVRYKLPPDIDCAACREHFHKIAPAFQQVKRLISSTSSGARAAAREASISGRLARMPRSSTAGRGSTESSSAMACARRSSSTRSSRWTDNARSSVELFEDPERNFSG